jgi:GT2 family glycosyltransferase
MTVAKPRLLFAITVYNGRDVVFSCLRSAARMAPEETEVDILVLDDASPEPGFSQEVEAECAELGISYYLSPRNLGIPRNVNLALLWALERDYDYVVVANSDVIFCRGLTDLMVDVAKTDSSIGSVTAWSNNVSVYSLLNAEPDRFLNDQNIVDWFAQSLYGNFGSAAVDIPAGISFCILIPTAVLRQVGLMDPVFGRGYCEETDWTLRSKSLGYRVALAPSCFVYHRGQVSNTAAGLLPAGHSTVPENEDIIDLRYPFFRSQVSAFINSDILTTLRDDASAKLMRDAANEWGYVVEFGQLPRAMWDTNRPVVDIESREGVLVAVCRFFGVTYEIPVAPSDQILKAIVDFFGCDPSIVHIGEPVLAAESLAATLDGLGVTYQRTVCYPTKV